MTLMRADWKRLRWPIAAALLLACVGATCFIASEQYLARAKTAREATRAQRELAQKRVEQVAEEEREIRSNLVSYGKMVKRGMTSQENRLDLIDEIARIKNNRRLFEIRYSIEPQKPLDYAGLTSSGAVDFV